MIAEPPDEWGGRALVDWTRRLALEPTFDPSASSHVTLAGILDKIYRAAA